MVDPELAFVKGRYAGAKPALWSSENRGPEYTLLGSEEPGFPVGLARWLDPERQRGIGKTSGHGLLYDVCHINQSTLKN